MTADREYVHGNEATVVRFPTPLGYDQYVITQTQTPPTGGWTSTTTAPTSISFTPPTTPGPITLYAWFTNSITASPLYHDAYTFNYLEEASITTAGAGGGSITPTPNEIDNIYALGSSLSLTATADVNHHFLYWEGDIPPSAYPTNNPLTFQVDRERALTGVFTSDAAPVRIWTGRGNNALASNQGNWLNNTAPQANDNVFFGFIREGARTDCTWDLDVAVANWTQSADFSGSVIFQTVYPDVVFLQPDNQRRCDP